MESLKIHSGGESDQKFELNKKLRQQIKDIEESRYLSRTEQEVAITQLKMKYRSAVKKLKYNLF